MAELGSLANDLVRLNVDVIVAGATPTSTLSRSAPATEEREARERAKRQEEERGEAARRESLR